MSEIADAVLMPCGHGGTCYGCSLQFFKKGGDLQRCHLCREYIEQILKIDTQTIFKDFIRVIESSQAAYAGGLHGLSLNHYNVNARHANNQQNVESSRVNSPNPNQPRRENWYTALPQIN